MSSVFSRLLVSLLCSITLAHAHSTAQFHLQTALVPLNLPTEDYAACGQVAPLNPSESQRSRININLDVLYGGDSFKLRTFEALGGAIRIPTESYDDLAPVGQDDRWDIFALLHEYLEGTFPLVYQSLRVTKVNTYGIVLHWQGSNESLLPVLMTAHQDVVPVEPSTVDQWVHPPYSGYYDGTWIWGRGSCDDKSDIISQLTTIESLLKEDFQPSRTFVFAFGFDEEASGLEGAGHLAVYLKSRYGINSFAALLDEGGGFGKLYGGNVLFAGPSTGEKGYLDVRLEVSTPGGHSSVPPAHTGIGILASAIVAIESQSHDASLARSGTVFQMLQCAAAHGPDITTTLRSLIEKAASDDQALIELSDALVKMGPKFAALVGTTQAVDLVSGGVKVNALPERVETVINHRIAEHSSVSEVQKHITDVILPVARKFNLTLVSFGTNETIGSEGAGHIILSKAWGTSLEPAPMTPISSSKPYDILAGTIKAALKSSTIYNSTAVVVSPSLAIGNTDTQFYWNLTKHIFRYSHSTDDGRYNQAHTVNEALKGEALIDKIRFHTKFILNWDESTS